MSKLIRQIVGDANATCAGCMDNEIVYDEDTNEIWMLDLDDEDADRDVKWTVYEAGLFAGLPMLKLVDASGDAEFVSATPHGLFALMYV